MNGEVKELGNVAKSEGGLLNCGEYNDWAYGGDTQGEAALCALYMYGGKASSEEHRQFQEWITLKEYGIQSGAPARSSRSKWEHSYRRRRIWILDIFEEI